MYINTLCYHIPLIYSYNLVINGTMDGAHMNIKEHDTFYIQIRKG